MFGSSLLLILDLTLVSSSPQSLGHWGCCCWVPWDNPQFISMLTTSRASFPSSAHRGSLSAAWQGAADHCLLLSLGFTNSLPSASAAFNPSQINSCLDEILLSVWPAPAQPAQGWFAFIPSGLCMITHNFIEFTAELCLETVFC